MEDIKWRSDSEILKQAGQKIREWRLEANISQKRLAEESGLSLFTVQQMEYGGNMMLGNLVRLLRTLDRLDFFSPFFERKPISPIEYEKMAKTPERKRAAKTKEKKNDRDIDGEPFW